MAGRARPPVALFPYGMVDTTMEAFDPAPDPYLTDPVGWMAARGERPWSAQARAANSVVNHRYTAVQACHDVGKSFIASRLLEWWIDVHPVGEAFVVWTAPRWQQVNAIIGRELRGFHKKHSMPGRITLSCDWYVDGDVLVGYGRKPADHDEHGFQGIHDRYVLVIIDEACGVPKALYNAVDALATNENARVLAIGNPDDPQTHFKTICQPGSGWNTLKISAFDSPNFTDELVSDRVRELLVSPTWVEEREKRWGKDSPLYISKVLGEFPEVSDHNLFPPSLVQLACDTDLEGTAPGILAFDIARQGSDETAGYRNRGGVVRRCYSARIPDTMLLADEIAATVLDPLLAAGVPSVIDAVGLGVGVFDRLRQLSYNVQPFSGGEAAIRSDRFINRRAEVYWWAAQAMRRGEIDLDPDDDMLLSQLQSIRWFIAGDRRIQIESKDDMRKRGMPSPDRADAFVMTLAPPVDLEQEDTSDPVDDLGITGDLLHRPW